MTVVDVATRLKQLDIILPKVQPPVGTYVPVVVSGNLIHVAGQVCVWNGEYRYIGRVGEELTVIDGRSAARLCGLNILSQLQAALGSLDTVKRCIRLNVYVRSSLDFTEQPEVADGASNLLVEVFGNPGTHTRSAVGVLQLPRGVAVEVDATFAIA
jgi:enamine deaminase RidA (YjgF/YER057c/UK114 family)